MDWRWQLRGIIQSLLVIQLQLRSYAHYDLFFQKKGIDGYFYSDQMARTKNRPFHMILEICKSSFLLFFHLTLVGTYSFWIVTTKFCVTCGIISSCSSFRLSGNWAELWGIRFFTIVQSFEKICGNCGNCDAVIVFPNISRLLILVGKELGNFWAYSQLVPHQSELRISSSVPLSFLVSRRVN